jgi:hypothetical protein
MKPLKAYMGYSRASGSHEGAVLVFAYSSQQAKVLTYKNGLVVDEYLDTAVKWLRDVPWLFKEAVPRLLKYGVPHVIECPKSCIGCGQWGEELIDGYCEGCISSEEIKAFKSVNIGDGAVW